ncbi:Putative aspartic peptidase A1 family, aspartic peptidase domain superfamily [Septoria linicola]|uniref:Aspartic peptidase A1 family, aspartic peptidase domain superfamily n=1 Tax=Septoria linicola TaxID=215465 RepID=A0A9Q9AV96_9PEZI|nr:putative aspartic peptidase A1 family, aspartic peptidase domain superfamily [Septoria linicola]USW53843.1 Putative aspartic peptidase A1 family, aspartic peptidase domain superfamily [Septoria linicola]
MGSFLRNILLLPCALLVHTISYATASQTNARADSNATSIPAPIAFHPDQNWDGIDGEWSSFTLRVGTPQQFVRTFVSFASYQTWVVLPQGCAQAADEESCAESRGWLFDNNSSSTFEYKGIYDLWVQNNLGYEGNAIYGYDTVGLGGEGEGGPTLLNTTVGAMAVEDFYLGVFGINPKPTNFTADRNGSPSYMTLLKEQKHIPSLSFGYTAGAKYRYSGVLASLTLGGYDSSKFYENDVTFVFAADNERDLVVVIQSITTPSTIESSPIATELLPDPVYAYIDSTVPEIWLPVEACRAFEVEFGLSYDNATNLYVVNDTLHDTLVTRNASVALRLGQSVNSEDVVEITLPYASFDLTAKPPYKGIANNTRYFPLQRAQNSSQVTLGRSFLQEAYISVDWESARFNVSQVNWDQNTEPLLRTIMPNTGDAGSGSDTSNESSGGLSTGAIAGIAVGVVAGIVLLGVFLYWLHRKKQAAAARQAINEKLEDDSNSGTQVDLGRSGSGYRKAELEGSSTAYSENKRLLSMPHTPTSAHPSSPGYVMSVAGVSTPTTPSTGQGTYSSSQSGALLSPVSETVSEADSRERHVYEMPGDMPAIREKDGKALSEKEALQYREQVYNGIASTTPTSSEHPRDGIREPRRIDPSEVVDTSKSAEVRDETTHKRFSFEGGASERELYS